MSGVLEVTVLMVKSSMVFAQRAAVWCEAVGNTVYRSPLSGRVNFKARSSMINTYSRKEQ
jgi:hypothetical protein